MRDVGPISSIVHPGFFLELFSLHFHLPQTLPFKFGTYLYTINNIFNILYIMLY